VSDGYFCGKGKDMQEADTWRELLATIISDNKEKQRITEELGITPITLTRWVNGESAPRPQNLRHLLTILPQYREQLVQLLQEEQGIGDLTQFFQEESEKDIPAEFYARIFMARASTTENLRFWSTCNLILQQAIGQIDPNRQGICLWVVRCMPPSGAHNKVRSLRESVGLATPPWGGNLEQQAMFLGAESLAGNVVTLCRPGIIQNLDEEHNLMPAQHVEYEKSAAIFPILYAGRIAGVFLVSSAQYNYFVLQARTSLVQKYADLLALAFEPEDFYPPEQIALHVMPSHEEQKQYFAQFRQLIADTMMDAANRNRPTNNIQADWKVWQRLEEDLLHYAAHQRVPDL
jgi:transcriptional regulator with XRE-family HTH domain